MESGNKEPNNVNKKECGPRAENISIGKLSMTGFDKGNDLEEAGYGGE